METNIFEIATKEKYRFPFKGMISTEDLWDLSAEDLDSIFKSLNASKKKTQEESLLSESSKEDRKLLTKIEIVKHIFAAKQAEMEARKQKAENAAKKRRIEELIASKEDAALGEKSVEELKKMLTDIDGQA